MDTRRRQAGPIRTAVQGLSPGYFALVMASGIISIGMRLTGHAVISDVLLVACGGSYVVLVVLTAWRLVSYRSAIVADFTNPRRAFGFFTFIAGTNVLGVRLAVTGHYTVTTVLLVISGVSWIVLGYVVPWTAVLGRSARPVVADANGSWFIWVVASQSVAVAAASLERVAGTHPDLLGVLAVLSWSVGVFLYAAAGVLVALRMMLYDLRPKDLDPPYWVSMGAAAITVLAGSRILEMRGAPMVDAVHGLVAGVAVVFWAFATWLIPALVAAGVWRHWVHRVPLRYEATLWSVVFPLGMYAVAGIYLGDADKLPIVGRIGVGMLWVALAAWTLTFIAMLLHLLRTVSGHQDATGGSKSDR